MHISGGSKYAKVLDISKNKLKSLAFHKLFKSHRNSKPCNKN